MKQRIKICLACSHGGHLTEMLELEEAFEGHDTFYFCYDADTTRRLPNAYLVPNMARNPIEFAKNLFRVTRIFRKERPDLVVSTGAEIAIPVVLIAKLFRVATVYIECGAQVARPSFTGRLMQWLADALYVQWPELLPVYGPRAMFRGSLVAEDDPVNGDRSGEKRMKVTLIEPRHPKRAPRALPPIDLAYIASVLERRGCDVRVIHADAEGLSAGQVARIVVQQAPAVVAVMASEPALQDALEIARILKDSSGPPVLVAATPNEEALSERLLQEDGFDYVVRGEAEQPMAEVVERLIAREDVDAIAGVSLRRDGAVVHGPERPSCRDLEQLPYPDWSLFPLKCYRNQRNRFSLPILTGASLPEPRLRSPENVVAEWGFLVERYGAEEILIVDEGFGRDVERVARICDLLIERGLSHVPWSVANMALPDQVAPRFFETLKQAGCYRVLLPEGEAARLASEAGIHVEVSR